MTKKTWLTIGGVIGIVGGSIALYVAGTGEAGVTALVAAIFVIAGIIAGFFGVGGTAKQAVEAYKASVADVTQAIEKK
jgi:uncharacterized membrane protein HdeD (DUF308 family)